MSATVQAKGVSSKRGLRTLGQPAPLLALKVQSYPPFLLKGHIEVTSGPVCLMAQTSFYTLGKWKGCGLSQGEGSSP